MQNQSQIQETAKKPKEAKGREELGAVSCRIFFDKESLLGAGGAAADTLALTHTEDEADTKPQKTTSDTTSSASRSNDKSTSAGQVASIVRNIVKNMVPKAKQVAESKIDVSVIYGGITNALFKAKIHGGESVVVRVFGAEGMIDRDKENKTFAWLSEEGVAPKYYGRFLNGRVEGYYEGFIPVTLDDLHQKYVIVSIARQLATLHKVKVPEYMRDCDIVMWEQLDTWLQQSKEKIDWIKRGGCKLSEGHILQYKSIPLDKCTTKISQLKKYIIHSNKKRDNQIVFCHNDLLCGNILKHPKTNQVKLIDFEYGGLGYRGFDIANHFNEWAGGTLTDGCGPGYNGVPDYKRFPSNQQQNDFCCAYLDELSSEFGGSSGMMIPDQQRQLQDIQNEVAQFVTLNHFYWGLWAVNRGFEDGCDDFDYMHYALARLSRGLE